MRCLNPDCDSVTANALNVSINVSITEPGPDLVWQGYTDFAPGGLSATLGTVCDDCEQEWWLSDHMQRIALYLDTDGQIGKRGGIADATTTLVGE